MKTGKGNVYGNFFCTRKGEVIHMDKKSHFHCQEDMDKMQHQLVEQINRIIVDEEEERMKAEIELSNKDGAES